MNSVAPSSWFLSLKKGARVALDARAWKPSHARLLISEFSGRPSSARNGYSDADHLLATAKWLASAQDAAQDGGVSGRFSLATGWSSSYPETTGYLVPTFLRLAMEPGLAAFEDRAARAIDFLLRCQLASGAFPGGEIAENTTKPSVFNSAQIICGLVAWHRHTNDQRALDAAIRAADWLVAVQDADGAWRRLIYQDLPTAYTAHASCWLAELGVYANADTYRDAAHRHLRWVLGLVDPETGWIDGAGFSSKEHEERIAFTHTIAYSLWGVLMSSELLGDGQGIAVAERAAGAIAQRLEMNQKLPGVMDWRWHSRATYSCVTGSAQMALIWLHLFERTSDRRMLDAGLLAIDTVKAAQPMRTPVAETRGALPGSDPPWGDYLYLAYPNWAGKFFADALLAKRHALRLLEETSPVTGMSR